MSTAARYLVFVRERFPPGAYLPLICVFVAAGYIPSAASSGATPLPLPYAVAALVVTAAFLHLRLVDEVKDAEVDRLGRPGRPLPRGLVTEQELVRGAGGLLVLALAVAATLGVGSLVGFLPAAVYILLADAEFFAPDRIHRNLVVYALVHSPVVPLLLVFAWWASPTATPSAALAGLVLLGWGVGLGLEVARKTYAPEEEGPGLETYSSALGRPGAVWLATGSFAAGMLGGALYAGLAGAGPVAIVAALVVAGIILAAGFGLRDARRRTIETVGTAVGFAILLWPIGVAFAIGGARP
jgi:4-hydroxybenzoate polyprenyltransferase